MSFDAGGLAQMSFNFQNNGINMPGAGFAARRNGSQMKRLSLASAPKVAPISENQESVPTPRTSRGHLLAGLRTAPKTPTASVPASAPYHQNGFGLQQSRYAGNNAYDAMPQTAAATHFGGYEQQYANGQTYSLPEQVLAPTQVQVAADEQLDPNVLAQLMATELFLEERRKQLQQQLLQLTNQGLALNNGGFQGMPNANMNYYGQQQQFANNMVQQDNQGQYVMFNPAIGQYQYVMQPNVQNIQLSNSPPPPTPGFSSSPPKVGTPTFRAEITPPEEKANPFARSISPPKKSSSPPVDVTPLPPPSANAFRPGHKKVPSKLSFSSSEPVADGPRTAFARSCIPATPATGSFGPGQGRVGEHPTRQPRGPPSIDELKAKPTSKHEGSRNFAARQRRCALNSLVRAGVERRSFRTGSAGSVSPVSETDMSFPASSDSESDASAQLSGKASMSSLRSAATRAIGSERQELQRNRSSADRVWTASSISSDEGAQVGGQLVEVKAEDLKPAPLERRVTPKLVLTSAEKRKTVF